MVSDFLKRKAAEYTKKQKEDGPAPSSPKDSKYENTRASSFLQEKAKTQAAYITDKFGDDAVGSTKWLMQDSALSDESLSGLLNRIKTLPGIGPGADTRRTSGGYYSLPEYDDGMEDLRKQIDYLSPAMREYGIPLETATSDLKQAENNLQITQNYLQKAMDAYKADPTNANAQIYNQIYAAYEKANAAYTGYYDAYNTEYQKYKATADQVAAIQDAYRQYSGQRQADYDAWRGSIRGAEDIRQELAALDAEIEQLQKDKALLGLAEGLNRVDAISYQIPGQVDDLNGQAAQRLQELVQVRNLLQEELDWSQHYRYSDLMQNEDFGRNSRYASTSNGLAPELNGLTGMYSQTGFDDLTYDYINRNEDARGKAMVNAIGDNTALLGLDKSYLEKMTDDEISVFNYLYATQGPDAAYEYTAYLTKDLNRRQREEMDAYWEKYAEEKPIESSLFSVLTSPLKGLSYLGQAADLAGTGKIYENAGYNKFSYVPNAIRGKVAETIEKSGKWGKAGSFAYQTGLSMADFLFATAASGGNSGLAMTIMGTGAAADTTLAAKERGVDDEKAMWLGAVAGFAEALTEKVSIETLLDPKLLKDGTWKYIVKNAMTEGAEEGASDLINLLADILIAGDQSEWRQSIQAHMADGMTEQEAFRKTLKDQMLTVGLDMLGGAISGGVMSGGNAAVQNRYNNLISKGYDLKNATAEDARAIIESGLESDPETESHQLAEQLQKKLDAGTIPTADELARLTWANEQAIQAEEAGGTPEGLRLGAIEETEDIREQEAAPEQNVNGGTDYESNRIYAGPAAAQGGRTDVLHGSSQRYDGTGTGEQTGSLAGRTGAAEERSRLAADARRAAVRRTDLGRSLRLEKVSSLDLGLETGTEDKTLQVIPEEHWDASMRKKAEQVYNETGKQVQYVLGGLSFRNTGGGVSAAKGVILGDRIIVQANHTKYTPEQIADHEAFHGMVDHHKSLVAALANHVVENYSEEEFWHVLQKYILSLREVIDVEGAATGAEYAEQMSAVMEELLADAHAGMNMWGHGATKFSESVNKFLKDNYISQEMDQENGTEAPTGPPNERYSFAGENANNADLEALARAKEMQAAGVADETIRQQTGWHIGMDGKWRWEIDDSAMQYHKDGDAMFSQMHPEYARHQELMKKFLYGELTEQEEQEFRELDETWGNENQRLRDRVRRGNAQLQNIIQHEELFDAYPQLRKTRLRFADLPEGTRGQYDPEQDVITLNESLRGKPQDTLIHEIQHAIQKAEGFSMGASTDFWEQVQKGERPVRANDRRVAEAERRIQEILDSLPPFVAGQFEFHRHLEKSDPDKAMELADHLSEGPYGDQFSDFFMLTWDLDMAAGEDNYIRGAGELYRNTAGEIEARDAASRRQLTAEQRRSAAPARADDRTVFVERFSVEDDTYMEAVNSGDMKAAQKMVEAAAERWGAYRNNEEANEVFHQDGRIRTFYHGTNTGDFTTFDSGLLGSSSGDLGWFGKGFYFAFSRDEAATYGGRVIPAYLRMRNPFDYSQLYKFKGSDKGASQYARFAWVYNMTKLFPDAVKEQRVWAYPNDAEEGSAVSWKQLAAWMDRIQKEKQFSVAEVEQNDGTTAWELRADPKKESFTNDDGDTFEWTEYGMTQMFATEKDAKEPINQIGAYLKNVMGIDSIPRRTIETIDFSGALQRAGYDGILQSMSGDEAVVFSPEQIKSSEPATYDDEGKVIPLSKRFSSSNPDIRYSVDDMTTEEYDALENEFAARQRGEKERFLRERLGDDGYAQFKADRDSKARQRKEEAATRAKVARQVETNQRKLHLEAETQKIDREERRRLQNETAPVKAKKALRNTVINLFSIPEGSRAELGTMIDNYAERIIKNGSLTEDDRKAFFDRMYASGVMTVPANDYFAEARSYLKEGRIYVPDSVVADFGDDWQDIRKRAFAAGIYLTRARNQNGHSVAGIDTWNGDLASAIPGLFDPEETDQRSILERIVQVAEEGKDEKLSLAEYTARLAEQEYVSEEEFLDNMERQMDWALRTFATSAGIEIETKEREIRKQTGTRRQNLKLQATLAAERQTRKEAAQKARDRKELQELQQRTLKQLQWLSQNRNRAPEELKETWDEVLGDIDLFSVSAANEMNWSQKHGATWKDLAQMYKDAQKNDPNFLPSKDLERIVTRLDATKIGEMDLGALQDLYKAAVGLRTEFYNRNNVINDEMQRLFAEVYTDAKKEIEAAPGGYTGKVMDKLLNLDQMTPMNVLQRMGGWDPNGAFYAMARQLEHGERDMRAYSVKAQKMLQEFLTEHEDWVKKADGQGKDGIWYEVEVPQLMELGMGDAPIFGPTVKVYMTPAQKVHMYLESKNFDNLRHMTGGRTFANKELYSQGKRQEALAQGTTIRMAPETVKALVADLTPEEMELARVLDQYYNQFATQEINRVSNILYGYDKAMGKNYAPIYTNRNYTKSEFGVFDATAEGVGNLKGRQYAVNPSYNISAFDAFERHKDQTARFVGMAIPARNWTTLMNWREKNNSTGDVITHKWGEESKRYIEDMITTLQAGDSAKTDTVSSGISKLQSNYISAIFGANPSIVLKQLGSIPMAGAYLDARNLPTPAQIAKIDREFIGKYTKELEWRTMGYTTPETKQLKDNPNWTQNNKTFKFIFGGGAITAMDGWAASVLWPWAENKVRREYPELEMGTQEEINNGESPFYKKVAEEFEDAMNRSQSVSDEIHQGRLRKSKSPVTRAFTMFRSDSAQTYNALRQKIGEARYYMRTGAKDQTIKAAKKAAGTAFMAMLVNAAWAESISFLMALWKNKGKYYRDDEDELTAESVAGEMVSNMLGSFAGVVTGGEEIFELIGNIVTGDTWYGIETPGMEQLNDLIDVVVETGSDMRDLVADAWDVVKNGGDLGEYFGKNSGTILSCVKDLAEAAAMYLPGLPVSNLEAYLMGAVKWVSPELGAAYDDLFDDVGKSDLAGAEGEVLQNRIGRILDDRKISQSDATAQALADLYAAGFKTAVPGDTPTSVTIDGEKHSLGAYQQQAYDTIWGRVVADALDDLVYSEGFRNADDKTKAKMLSNLYDYAAAQAKAELFDDYQLDSGDEANAAIVAAGATVAECIAWNTLTSGMKSGEKSAELASWSIPEKAKREIFRSKISDSRDDTIAAFEAAGLSFDQFLDAYSMYGQINNEDLQAGVKATEFAHWVNSQGYTDEQADMVKDELTYFNMTPASSTRYDKLVDAGMDPEEAFDLTGVLNELQPEEGEDDVSDLQKWRASVEFSTDVEDQLTALYAIMSESQFMKVEIAYSFGVNPEEYVSLYEIRSQYDADKNGSYTNAEIRAAIDAMSGSYSAEQKAVLWQLATGSTSAKNNPYSKEIGQKVLDAKEAAKNAAAEEEELEGLKLGSW